jgi:hypothetical protein
MSTRLRRRAGVVERSLGGSLFLAHPTDGRVHRLNATSAALWRLFETPTSLREAVLAFQDAFPRVAPARIEREVRGVLEGLTGADLVVGARTAARGRAKDRAARGGNA